MYIHRVLNNRGMYDVMLDSADDLAGCCNISVAYNHGNYVKVMLHNDPTIYLLHHLLVGDVPDGYEVDHIDGNPTNNTRCNLRLVTHKQNMLNRYVSNPTGFAGVKETPNNTFAACVWYEGKNLHIGTFQDPVEAAMMRDEVTDVTGGGYSRSNFEKSERCLNEGHMRKVAAFLNRHNIKV